MHPPSASEAARAPPAARNADAAVRVAPASAHHLFPALPDKSTALLQSVLQQLEQSQWWDAGRLVERQSVQLAALLEFVIGSLPFYCQRLAGAGIAGAGDLAPEAWARVPVLTRQQLQANVKALKVRKPPAGHRELGLAETSGSTGTPIRVATTETTRLLWQAFVLREHYWHARDFGASLAAIRLFGAGVDAAYPHGLDLPDWGPPVNLLHDSGRGKALDIHTDPRRQLEWLSRVDPAYLITFPSNAAALARLALAGDVALPGLREVRLVSEAVDADLRATLHQAWGVPVVDTYSAQEAGTLALQCPEHPHYHVQSENVLLEVVDAQGRACGPGETGRVLVTTLHNFAMPLIRYEIGDYAEVGPPCPCGRGLPVLSRILGRVRNMLVLPNGEQRWPSLAATFYRELAPVVQHQLVQHDLEDIEARLVVERPLTTDEEEGLRAMIVTRLDHPFAVRFSYHASIARSPSGKFEEFVSRVQPAADAPRQGSR